MPAGFVLPWSPFRTHTSLSPFPGTVQRSWSPTGLRSLFPSSSLPWGSHAGASADPCGLWPVACGWKLAEARWWGGQNVGVAWPCDCLHGPLPRCCHVDGASEEPSPYSGLCVCLEAVRRAGCLPDGQPGPQRVEGLPAWHGATVGCVDGSCEMLPRPSAHVRVPTVEERKSS